MATLGERVRETEEHLFVGREEEIAAFESWLDPDRGDSPLIFSVSGPGGIGKTTLLRRLEAAAVARGLRVVAVSGTDFSPTPEGLFNSLSADGFQQAVALLSDGPTLLTVDAFEFVEPLVPFLRDKLLPAMPTSTKVVIVGRRRIEAQRWRRWLPLVERHALSPLEHRHAREYLKRRRVHDAGQQEAILAATHGVPLALSVAADAAQRGRLATRANTPSKSTPLLRGLVDDILTEVAAPRLRAVVEAAVVVRRFDEEVLARMLDDDSVSVAFAELTGLSFVEAGRYGLSIHDEIRSILSADLQLRSPERWQLYRERAVALFRERLSSATDPAQRELLLIDGMALHALRPHTLAHVDDRRSEVAPYVPEDLPDVLRVLREWKSSHAEAAATMTDDERDEPTVQAIVEATMNHVSVARSPRGEVHGYGFILPICTATVALLPPAGQLRRLIDCWVANEGATIADSADQSRAWVISTVVCGEYRAEMAEAALREYGLTVVVRGGQYLAVTGRDVFSSLLEAAGGRKLITLGVSVPGGPPLHGWLLDIDSFGVEEWTAAMMTGRKPVPRLHGKELETAVQEAVVNWRSDEHLARSRLLSRLSGESRTPTALRELLRSAMQQARVQARDDLAIRAVELAYVERSGSIERVADQLHVSRATLFRLLRRGVEEIAHQLA